LLTKILSEFDLTPEQRAALLVTILPEQVDKLCIARLQSRGYVVTTLGQWETRSAICKRLNISRKKFTNRLKRYPKLGPGEVQRGPSGRLLAVRSNPTLDCFLVGPKRAVRKMESQIARLAPIVAPSSDVRRLKSKRRQRKKAG